MLQKNAKKENFRSFISYKNLIFMKRNGENIFSSPNVLV